MPTRYTSQIKDPGPLAEPLTFAFSGKTAPNRFMKAALTERLSSWHPTNKETRGVPSKELIRVYQRWGEGLMGVILTGNIMVDFDSLESAGNMIIPPGSTFDGERFAGFQQLAIQAKAHGSLVLGQVSHPGRQVERSLEPNPLSASDVQLDTEFSGMKFNKPRAASLEDIKDIVNRFTHAAEYLHQAGFDGIQLHGAHGYLLAQFLSQTTNKRSDQYGGSLYNRARLILDIAQSIRQKLPSSSGFILGIKINSVEFQQDGFTTEEAKELCQLLEQNEFDFVELSGGTYQSLQFVHKRDSTRKREAFFLEFADKIVPVVTKTKAYITGGFKTLDGMVNALKTVDGVGLGRPVCQEFRLAKDFLHGQNSSGGAVLPILDQDDFGTTVVVARAQTKQVGKDQEPTDISVQENVDAFLKDMGTWTENVKLGVDRVDGIVDLMSVKTIPYGSVAAA